LTLKKVVITGAPGTGKTEIIKGLEAKGLQCFHEVIRTMTAKAKSEGTSKKQVSNPLAFVDNPYKFNQHLLQERLHQFNESEKLAFIAVCNENHYEHVFILPPWKEIYVSDNERLETFLEAEQLHENLMESYLEFGYSPILVPKTTIGARISFILNKLKLV